MRALAEYVSGIEYLEYKVTAANDARVRQGDIQALPFADATFDALILNEVLEHVPDDSLALRGAHRVLRPQGVLLLFSPNRLYPFETHGIGRLRPIQTFGLAVAAFVGNDALSHPLGPQLLALDLATHGARGTVSHS